jgi:diguanylate cyclase (GGDEF)-like protein
MIERKQTTGVEYLGYKKSIFRRQILRFEQIVIGGLAIIEFIFIMFNSYMTEQQVLNDKYYLKAITAVLFCIICERISYSFQNNNKIRNITKNRISCVSLFLIAMTIGLLHYTYCIFWIVPSVIILFGTVFGDRILIFIMTVLNLILLIAYPALIVYHENDLSKYYRNSFVIAVVLSVGIFVISQMLLQYNLNQYDDIVKRYDGESELKKQLNTEYLTGLLSRSAVTERLNIMVNEAYYNPEMNLCVAMLDMDFFKQVNDTYGHDKGDLVLVRLARVIKKYVDDSLIAGRFGGEEFLIVFKGHNLSECTTILNEMLNDFKNQQFEFLPDNWYITFSVGICSMFRVDLKASELIKYADIALYYAKGHGRSQITEFKHTMLEE